MNTHQLAAEAAEKIRLTSDTMRRYGPTIYTLSSIIKSAIEKAINDYDAKLDRIQNNKGQGIMHQSRAAHSSEEEKE